MADRPPLFERYFAVMVRVDTINEACELCVVDEHSRSLERCSKFVLVKPPVVVSIYCLEQLPELVLCVLNEGTEL